MEDVLTLVKLGLLNKVGTVPYEVKAFTIFISEEKIKRSMF